MLDGSLYCLAIRPTRALIITNDAIVAATSTIPIAMPIPSASRERTLSLCRRVAAWPSGAGLQPGTVARAGGGCPHGESGTVPDVTSTIPDVLVIGAGVCGLSSAITLLEAG